MLVTCLIRHLALLITAAAAIIIVAVFLTPSPFHQCLDSSSWSISHLARNFPWGREGLPPSRSLLPDSLRTYC